MTDNILFIILLKTDLLTYLSYELTDRYDQSTLRYYFDRKMLL